MTTATLQHAKRIRNNTSITVSMSFEARDLLKKVAEASDMSMSQVASEGIMLWLEKRGVHAN